MKYTLQYIIPFLLLVISATGQAPTNLAFQVGFTGTTTENDIAAARFIIDSENVRRAAIDPPESPLPTGNSAEIKASYLTILAEIVTKAHNSYIIQAGNKSEEEANVGSLWKEATQAQRDAAIAALTQ